MNSLDRAVEFVNQQISFHAERAEIYSDKRKHKHSQTKQKFIDLLAFLNEQQESIEELSTQIENRLPKQLMLSLTPEDIKDLPEEQLEELSFSGADKDEFAILGMLEDAAGGVLSLDQIIVSLYRQSGEIQKRATVTSKMYRMMKKGLVYAVPLKKGIYSLHKIEEEEAKDIFKIQ